MFDVVSLTLQDHQETILPDMSAPTANFSVRMPQELRDQLEEVAKREERSVNQVIIRCLRSCIESRSKQTDQKDPDPTPATETKG